LGIPSGEKGILKSELGIIESAMVDQHDIQTQLDRIRAVTPALAEQVVGYTPPEWLIEYFVNWSGSLARHRHVWEQRMSRVQVIGRLEWIELAALELSNALSEPELTDYLAREPNPYEIADVRRVLILIHDWAEGGSKSAALVNVSGKTRAGAGLAIPPRSISPQVFCALIVSEAWKYGRGRRHGPRNLKAAAAAQELWGLAVVPGGERLPRTEREQRGDPLNGWRPHFEAVANEALYENDRTELVRYLKNAAHHSKMLGDMDSNS
jgi:hypothetical protein